MNKAINIQRSRVDDLYFFPLERLLPAGQALSVNTTNLIISLVSTNSANGNNPILLQQSLTETDMRLLLVLLESPYFVHRRSCAPVSSVPIRVCSPGFFRLKPLLGECGRPP